MNNHLKVKELIEINITVNCTCDPNCYTCTAYIHGTTTSCGKTCCTCNGNFCCIDMSGCSAGYYDITVNNGNGEGSYNNLYYNGSSASCTISQCLNYVPKH